MSDSEEVKRIREKMKKKEILLPAQQVVPIGEMEALPSMGKIEKSPQKAEELSQKADKGAAKMVSNIMKQPEVQHVIRVEINKQMFISGLFMAFFLVGFFQLFSVAKVVFGYNWSVDLVIGVIMCIMGATYTVMQVRKK